MNKVKYYQDREFSKLGKMIIYGEDKVMFMSLFLGVLIGFGIGFVVGVLI